MYHSITQLTGFPVRGRNSEFIRAKTDPESKGFFEICVQRGEFPVFSDQVHLIR